MRESFECRNFLLRRRKKKKSWSFASFSPFKERSKAPAHSSSVLSCFFCHDHLGTAKEASLFVSHAGSPAAIERCRFEVSSTHSGMTREESVRAEVLRRRRKEKKALSAPLFPSSPCAVCARDGAPSSIFDHGASSSFFFCARLQSKRRKRNK